MRVPILPQNISILVVYGLSFKKMYRLRGYEGNHWLSGPHQKYMSGPGVENVDA